MNTGKVSVAFPRLISPNARETDLDKSVRLMEHLICRLETVIT